MSKKTNVPFYTIIAILFLFFGTASVITNSVQDPKEWEVPERFKQMENPVEMDNQSLRIGRSLYRRNCRDCHGSEGKGDGSEAPELETTMRDFGSEEVQSQRDGELFYKVLEGRDEMPSFRADLIEEDIWNIVNYIRSLKEE